MAKASDRVTTDFGSPDWPSIDDAFKRFLEVARGDPALAARDLQRTLEDDHDPLKSGYVRTPRQYRKTNESLIWIPENEERGLLSSQFWRAEARVEYAHAGFRCVPRSNKGMLGRYLFFVRRSDLDAIFAPARPAKAATSEPTVEAATPEPAIKKEDIARRLIQKLYERPAHTLSDEFKTGTVRQRVNGALKLRNNPEHFSWDTINRALGRGSRRKKK